MLQVELIKDKEVFVFGGLKSKEKEFEKKVKLKNALKIYSDKNPDINIIFAYYNIDLEWEIYGSSLEIDLPEHPLISEYCVQEYSHNGLRNISISRRKQKDNSVLWAVCMDGSVLDRYGDLTRNSLPSSRSEEELMLTRFSLKEAIIGALYLIEVNKKHILPKKG